MLFRTPTFLAQSIKDAEEGNYALGVKLVRGAYHPHELAVHRAAIAQQLPPVSLEPSLQDDPSTSKSMTQSGPKSFPVSPDVLPPVWLFKAETDACYNEAVRTLISRIYDDFSPKDRTTESDGKKSCLSLSRSPRVGVLFGTHNWDSCDVILNTLVGCGLASKEVIPETNGRIRSGITEVVRITPDVAEQVTIGQLYGTHSSKIFIVASSHVRNWDRHE